MIGSVGNTSSSVDYTFTTLDKQQSDVDLLKKHSDASIGDEKKHVEKGQTRFLKHLLKNKYGSSVDKTVSKDDVDDDVQKLLHDKENSVEMDMSSEDDAGSITGSFYTLAAAAGANARGVTKQDLFSLLQKLSSGKSKGSASIKDITFIKNLIAKFDSISGGEPYINSLNGMDEPQDPETVTKAQVTPPIDIRI